MNYYKITLLDIIKDYTLEFTCTREEMQRLIANMDYEKFHIASIYAMYIPKLDINQFIKKPDGLETGDK